MGQNFHEDLGRAAHVRSSSDRQFGLVIAAALALFGLLPLRSGGHVRMPLLALAGVFLLAALVWPAGLHPLNRVWTGLGLLMGRLVNPIVTAVLFYVVITPVGLIAKLMGSDLLRLKLLPAADTYWIHRTPPGPPPASMTKQF